MTTPSGQEPRSRASRAGTARSRREDDPGWSTPGGGGPSFTPSRPDSRAGGRPPREPGQSQDGRGYNERAGAGRGTPDREFRDRTDDRDSPRPPRDPGGPRGGARRGDPRGQTPDAGAPRSGLLARWIGRFPVKGAFVIFFGIAVLGAIATLVTGNDPGSLLGNLIVLGAVIAALGIRRQGMYLLIPLPALTYLVLAIVTGGIHDSGADTSTTQLGLNFLQWIGNGFFSLCAATILVLLIFGARLLASRQLVSGSFPMSEQRPAAGRSGRTALSPGGRPDSPGGRTDPRRDDRRRTSRAPWDDPDPWYDQGPRDRDSWTDRDGREDRDSRGSRDDRGSRDGRAGRDGWSGDDSRQDRRPDRRAGNRSGDDRGRDDRRPGPRNVPPGRGEPPTRALPPERDSRPGNDSRDDRGYRGGGTSRGSRDSRDSRDSRGRTSRSGRGSWDGRDPRGR